MDKDRFSKVRFQSIAIMFAATLIPAAAVVIRCALEADMAFCLLFLILIFFLILLFAIEYERVHGFLSHNTQSSFRMLCAGYSIGSLMTAGFVFLPDFFQPVLLLAVLMSALSNERIALTCGLFWCVMLGIAGSDNQFVMIANILLVLLGCVLCVTLKEPKYRLYISFLFFCLPILVTSVFFYWSFRRMTAAIYIYGIIVGLVTAAGVYFCYDLIFEEKEYEVAFTYHKLVDHGYPRVRELWNYSPKEYDHARTVSNLARECAKEIGIDSDLCEAAGFYYRMGRWVGEPFVENGVKRAQQLCFPLPLQQILAEFGGEKKPISTKESALVHMVDTLVLKGEVMEEQMGNSRWNRDMLVYQTVNDLSGKGLYDQSCLSINEFLRARDFLTKAIHEDAAEEEERT